MEVCILNGKFVNRERALVDIEDRGYQFGDGIYEVIRVYNGKPFTATEHITRLFASAEKLNMKINYQKQEIQTFIEQLIDKNELELGIIYMQFTRGVHSRSHAFPDQHEPTFVAYTRSLERPLAQMEKGVSVITTEDIRWLRCDIKSLNLLGNILAKEQAKGAGCFEAIQHRDKNITEGSSANVMIVKDGQIKTHPANNLILNGITRQKVAEICKENNIPFIESVFTITELYEADEAFLTGTTTEVMPIINVDNKKIGDGTVGAITLQLQKLFEKAINEQCQ